MPFSSEELALAIELPQFLHFGRGHRRQLEDVAGEMMQAVGTVPAYSRPLEGPFGEGLRAGVHEALRHLLAEIEAGGSVERTNGPTLRRAPLRPGVPDQFRRPAEACCYPPIEVEEAGQARSVTGRKGQDA